MKKFLVLLITMLATVSIVINGKPGCLSKSYHLKQKFDPKEYHLVECNCPCDYWAMKGLHTDNKSKCLECNHAHNPGPNPYTPQALEQRRKNTQKSMEPYVSLHKLIAAYENKNK